jgi:cellulose synthase/poly-beta-1,6-N-acetylglucosamine synthase-like glycosyltransferase
MISIIITAYKEPKTIGRAIEAIKRNKIKNCELIVAAPDKETADVVKKYMGVTYFKDAGKGKSHALNQLFKKVKSNILILTDGDVFVDENAIQFIINAFKDPRVGCVSGRPVAANDRTTFFGYLSHLLLDAGAHAIRKKLYREGKFLECSGYLFAFRHTITKIPTDVAEDAYIPYLLWKKGYSIHYAEHAKVFVQYPDNLKDFIKQRVRTAKSHSRLQSYAVDFPTVKSFWNEVRFGFFRTLLYPRTLKEFFWTLTLYPIRFYIWLRVYFETSLSQRHYQDDWERIESTKTNSQLP